MTDSTTLEGWLQKTNFIKDGKDLIQATIRLEFAYFHASQYLSNGIQEYSHCFPGAKNNIADALSRDNDRSDKELTHILCSHCPSQLPKHFKLVPLPSEITSWLTLLLLRLPVKQQLMEAHSRKKLGRGEDTPSTASLAVSETTSS
jgi:hypothetical protein